MEQQIQQVEEIVEFEEDVEIIPEISETDLARNEMVADADFIEEIPEPEIELEEVEEVSLLPGPFSCPKTFLVLNQIICLVLGQICFG